MRLNLFSFTLNACQNELLIAQHRFSHNRLYSSLELIIRRQRNSLRSTVCVCPHDHYRFILIFCYIRLSEPQSSSSSSDHFNGTFRNWNRFRSNMQHGDMEGPTPAAHVTKCCPIRHQSNKFQFFRWHWHGTPPFVESFYKLQWYSTDSDERKCVHVTLYMDIKTERRVINAADSLRLTTTIRIDPMRIR